jgi:hypothetical protein
LRRSFGPDHHQDVDHRTGHGDPYLRATAGPAGLGHCRFTGHAQAPTHSAPPPGGDVAGSMGSNATDPGHLP